MGASGFLRTVALGLGVAIASSGCLSARMSHREVDRAFYAHDYEGAAGHLSKGLEDQGPEGKDRLLYLLDLGIALHTAGKYDESIRALLEADKLAEIKDYTSLVAEAGTLFVSDNTKDYKAEDFENVLINTILALNYAAIGDFENALVESRRVNRKLYLMVTEGKRPYKLSPFAEYLTATLYESQGEWNDALVSYKKVRELAPEFPSLGMDLWRMAWRLRMSDEMERWAKEYNLEKDALTAAKAERGKSEIVVVFENGVAPLKRSHPILHEIPVFNARYNPVSQASVEVDGVARGSTRLLDDIEGTAIKNLEEKYAGIVAKKIAGRVAKRLASDALGRATKSEALGDLVNLVLLVADQADLRSWSLLPRDLQIARVTVEPGLHSVKVTPGGDGIGPLVERTVSVKPGQKVFVPFRYVP